MNIILIGNIISFIGCAIMVATGLIKTKKKILIAQNAQYLIQGIANLILGGVTGFVSNLISMARNIYCLKFEFNIWAKIAFIVAQFIFTALTNTMGLAGWLPFIAATIFTLSLDTKDEKILKLTIIACEFCWIIFDLILKNYTAFAFDIFTIISTIVGIIMLIKKPNTIEE